MIIGIDVDDDLPEIDQLQIKQARELADQVIAPLAREISRPPNYLRVIHEALAAAGLLRMPFPEKYGGTATSMLGRVRVMEELCRVDTVAGSVISGTELGAMPLILGGTESLKSNILPELAMGTRQAAFALTEHFAGTDVSAITTRAEPDGVTGWRITGNKHLITRASISDYFCVFAKTDWQAAGPRGISCFWVPANTKGITISSPLNKMAWEESPVCDIDLDHVIVEGKYLLGEVNKGYNIAFRTLNKVRLLIAASATGRAQCALELAVQYARRRQSGGKPIGLHQGIRWLIADMATAVEASRRLTYAAALAEDGKKPEAPMGASMAKAYATDTAMKVTTSAVQIFGGNGYLRENIVERLMRESKLGQIMEGTNEIHRDIVGRRLVKGDISLENPLWTPEMEASAWL